MFHFPFTFISLFFIVLFDLWHDGDKVLFFLLLFTAFGEFAKWGHYLNEKEKTEDKQD